MAYFNELSTDMLLVLNEMKTREEYHRRSFKKKYNFVPDKPGGNTGTITTKDGKKYHIDMEKSKTMDYNGWELPRETGADTSRDDGHIYLDKEFFKLKGSNKSERRDAALHHEIGHQNLHNINSNNKTVDKRNRTPEVAKNLIKSETKDQGNPPIESYDHAYRKRVNDEIMKDYMKNGVANKKEKAHRNEALNAAKKYEKPSSHANAIEYEADRFAANRTSESAIKKGLREAYKKKIKEVRKETKRPIPRENMEIVRTDMEQRSKALKDKTLRSSDVYK